MVWTSCHTSQEKRSLRFATLFGGGLAWGQMGRPDPWILVWAVRSGSLKLVTERTKTLLPPALFDLPAIFMKTMTWLQPARRRRCSPESLFEMDFGYGSSSLAPQGTQFILNTSRSWPGTGMDSTKTIPVPSLEADESDPLQRPMRAPDGFNWFTTTVRVAATGGDTTPGDHSFVLVGARSYCQPMGRSHDQYR